MFCITLEPNHYKFIKELGYTPVGLGNNIFSKEWLTDKEGENISHKNKNYGEYTYHYWLWKNYLHKINEEWIGFCQYRKFWSLNYLEPKDINVNTIESSTSTLTIGESGNSVVAADSVNVNLVKDASGATMWQSNGSGVLSNVNSKFGDSLVLISTQTASSSASISFTSGIDATYKELIDFSKVLEGMHRHASTHAAGVVIAPGPLTDYVPLFKSPSTGDITTQTEMGALEDLGLLKMDFLGLRNLTVINKAVLMIEKNHGEKIDISKIDLEDEKVFALFTKAQTIGIFQFESDGMREYLNQLKPTSIGDLIAMNALYRPGPMANIPEFIARKNGLSIIDYIHPSLETVLKETYGIIVYQEQVMQIGSVIGGFTLAQSDEMRKAMGKKKKDLMATFKIDFINGAESKGLSQELAIEIFDLLAKFADSSIVKFFCNPYR